MGDPRQTNPALGETPVVRIVSDIVGRGDRPIGSSTKRKISAFCDLPQQGVIIAATVPDIYQFPTEMEKEGAAEVLSRHLHLESREVDSDWYSLVAKEYTSRIEVGIVSKYGVEDVYMSLKEALKHAGRACSTEVKISWLDAGRMRFGIWANLTAS